MKLHLGLRSAVHRKEKKPIYHQPQTSKLYEQIPAEILDIIYEQLPTLEQIYLALTCKSLYIHFVSFLKTKNPDHAKLLIPRENRLPIHCNAELEKHPRIQLLRQLENIWWKCCVVSFKRPGHSNKDCHCYKCGVLQGHDCMPYAGLVDICPCLSIAFKERELMVAMIRPIRARVSMFHEDFPYELSAERTMHPDKIMHRCKVTSHVYAQVSIETTLYIKQRALGEALHVQNSYTFDFSEGFPGVTGGICPHKQTTKWLKQFFVDAGLDYSAWGAWAYPKATEAHIFEVVTKRNLGYRNWNKSGWKNNRNDR
ncbi:unnamed protein product [Penicillium glandicola]